MAAPLFLPVIVGLSLVVVVSAVVGLIVMVAVLRRPVPAVYGRSARPRFSMPLEHARKAASALTPEEWEEFRRWVDGARPPSPTAGNGVAR